MTGPPPRSRDGSAVGRRRTALAYAEQEVRCPSCGATYRTRRRWSMVCPRCHHAWVDRSSRSIVDELRDFFFESLGRLLFLGGIVFGVAIFGTIVVSIFLEVADVWGAAKTYGIAALFVVMVIAVVVMGKVLRT